MKKRFWVCLFAAAIPCLNAMAEDLLLPNGSHAQGTASGNRLLLATPAGQVPAPDGQYRAADGRTITVRGGLIVSGLAVSGMARAIGPKPDDPLAARNIPPVTNLQTPTPAGNTAPTTFVMKAPVGSVANPGLPPLQPIKMQSSPVPQGTASGATTTALRMPASPVPASTSVAGALSDPATQLAAARAQNRRLKAMIEDLKRRIASGRDDRQLFCTDDVSFNKQGVQRSCFPFACNLDTGACFTSATGSDQCAAGELWDEGSGCVAPPPPRSYN